jgi:hypothetical protein
MIYENLRDNLHLAIQLSLVAVISLTLMACQTRAPTPEPQAVEQPIPSAPPEQQVFADISDDIEPELVCPEPAPIPEFECPPPPKPKPCPLCPAKKIDGKILVGETEKVTINPPGVTYTARIDTGASGTSIHATNIVRFERDGEDWVRFQLENPNGEPFEMEREVVRSVRVRQVELDEFERRMKVMLTMKIGNHSELVEFSLNDRSEMEHPILLGRNFLRNNAIVDVSQEFIAK